MNWIVVKLKPNQSKKAEENLIKQGFKIFFPKISYTSGKKLIVKDLFPGYGFVQFNKSQKLVSINSTKGISSILRFNDLIPKLADSVIKNIKNQLKDLNSRFATNIHFKRDDQVIVKLKLLNNQEAEVINVLNKKESQKVLLKILNSSQVVWVDSKYLEAKLVSI